MPPSVIRTPDFDAPYRLSFGSCRRSAPFDAAHLEELGADALVALAGRMVGAPHDEWPDILLLLGDQVYADDPSDEILARLRETNRERDPEIVDEIQDFEEYTWLYQEAWTTPVVRWLLSTVPTGMLLDDHDLRDDWNTSLSLAAGGHGQVVVARPRDRRLRVVLGVPAPRATSAPSSSTPTTCTSRCWPSPTTRSEPGTSTTWPGGPTSTRRRSAGASTATSAAPAGGCGSSPSTPGARATSTPTIGAWSTPSSGPGCARRCSSRTSAYDHLILASTLPFLLLPGVHHLEGWDESISEGAWGRPGKWVGEKLRQVARPRALGGVARVVRRGDRPAARRGDDARSRRRRC